jgi:hypothetical protein
MKLLFITLVIFIGTGFHASAQSANDTREKLQGLPGADTSTVIKELISLLDRNYVSGHIYFYGAGFLQTQLVTFSGDAYAYTRPLLWRVRSGSKVAFGNCIYLDDKKQKKTFTKILTLP